MVQKTGTSRSRRKAVGRMGDRGPVNGIEQRSKQHIARRGVSKYDTIEKEGLDGRGRIEG